MSKDEIINKTVKYVKWINSSPKNKHIESIDKMFKKHNPNFNPVKNTFKFYYGEFRGTINKTHRNWAWADFVYGEALNLKSWLDKMDKMRHNYKVIVIGLMLNTKNN